jgi:GNAT superfamily N-acetyltransferase
VAALLADRYDELPAIFGPRDAAVAVADAWVDLRGGSRRTGMPQGLYRLDSVTPPPDVPGRLRPATIDDVERVVVWGQGFARDTGIPFPPGRDPVLRWIEHEILYLWEDDGTPVSVSVAHGRTERGIRIGYVYTPPERRGQGYASALVAELSQSMLDSGLEFCVLYTDLTNPTSNAIYQRLGYRLIAELTDVDLVPGATP